MSESSATGFPTELHEYLEVWATSAAQVLTTISGHDFPVECLEAAEAPPAADTDLHLGAVAAGALRGEMCLRLPQAEVLRLAQLFLGEAPEAQAEFRPDHREAVEELFRQVAGQVATALKPKWGEVQLRVESGAAPSWAAAASAWLRAGPDPAPSLTEVTVSAALLTALRPALAQAADPAATGEGAPGQLDLLMDVELDLTLRFGGRRLLLKEILELNPGAVVELDRQIEEPVDLLLDGRLLARGEVVVVDGNYGFRVRELVASPPPGRGLPQS